MTKKRNINNKELFYDDFATEWESKINNVETDKRIKVVFKQFLSGKEIRNKNFLEVGCGLGYFSHKAGQLGAKVTGVDIGPKLVEINKKKTKGKFIVASAAKLPFKNSSFDVLLSTEVIEHVEKQHSALKEMYRVLKKQGTLTLTTPNRIFKPLFDFLSIIRIRPYHGNENWYFPWDLKNELESLGFETVKEYYFNFIYPNKLFDMLENKPFLKFFCINYGIKLRKK